MRYLLLPSLLTVLAVQSHQGPSPEEVQNTEERLGHRPQAALEAWRGEHGASWRTVLDREHGYADMLHGGSTPADFVPLTDEDRVLVAREFAAATEGVHGIVPETLGGTKVAFLPLGQIGSTDKWNVKFRQEVEGVPVVDAYLNVLLSDAGDLLSVQTTAVPAWRGAPTDTLLDADTARGIALRLFAERTSTEEPGNAGEPQLVFLPVAEDKRSVPVLAWQVDVHPQRAHEVAEAWRFWIDDVDGELIRDKDLIEHFDVGGTVQSNATPGVLPDTGSNPETAQNLGHLRVTSSAGTVFTDENGSFNFPGASGPLNVTVDYVGTYNDVRNNAGGDYSLTTQAQTGQGNVVLMNPSSQALVTAQANSYIGVVECRDWIVSINPTDTTANFQAVSNANLNDTCNAFFNGVSINMFQAGGGCVNTAYRTVVVHEYGHWLNVLYSTGNGSDGMGEGNADVWSMYLYDEPIVGENFCGGGCHIRTGLNTRQYCGDGNGGCYGQVHADGEVWMGAAWKIRTRLQATLGTSAGSLAADTLFLAWMSSFNQTQIDSVIETQWLTLDDDDGNIDNGTPNYTDVDQGFRDQGFPGYDLALISITGVTQLPNTPNAGTFVVDATIAALQNPPITSVELVHRVNGGAWITSFMSPTTGSGWTGAFTVNTGPASVDYYVRAYDSASNPTTSPIGAPTDFYNFDIGTLNVLFFDDFETAGDNGWTHNTFGDTSNSQDDWQHGPPNGKAGDPNIAYSGTQCWGNDLGPTGWNGAYQDNVHNYLRSPNIDCSSAVGTRLRYRRWLEIESGQWDQAQIRVNGTLVWENEFGADNLDGAWILHDIDISSVADGNAAVQIEFSLTTDTSVVFGGWNVDDVEVLYLSGGGITDCNSNSIDDATDISNGTSLDCQLNGIPDECELAGNDCDLNGVPDECDTDCNTNGTPDVCETITDCNSNSIPDECETTGNDCDANGVPDECDTDCNSNGTPDACEVITDCNSNSVPDECELVGNDCDLNGVPDDCDTDCNTNGTPDVCEVITDCNSNSVPDECELAGNDCDVNGVPDECDTDCNSNGTPDVCEAITDCNSNAIPDECELAGNDCDVNGIPDECDTDCDLNGTPDACELAGNDCDLNGVLDVCDPDCNSNGTPDACESFADCNSNGTPDECDLVGNDCDLNGVPDSCDPDCDSDGTPDACEVFTDCNGNTVPDDCELVGNDCDANGIPDDCDTDCNSNGTPDACEAISDCNSNAIPDECELAGNDCDVNGVPDECDTDCDSNGTPDDCELTGNDCDSNGVLDACDPDCNVNGTPDACEAFADCNSNAVPDECELAGNDCDINGVPDECDTDCNTNGTPDACEAITDCNSNAVPDECELSGNDCDVNGVPDECDADCNTNGTPDACEVITDCNSNSVPDECELAGNDCDINGVPDDCDTDCNSNGTPDACEVITDCNSNAIPDECELVGNDCNINGVPDECEPDCDASGIPDECEIYADCNGNQVPDPCDITAGTSDDLDGDGQPDECQTAVSFCSGDGSAAACPCGNTGSAGAGCGNSAGGGARLFANGSNSIIADDLAFVASGLIPGQSAMLFYGNALENGGVGTTLGDGLRCVGGQIQRLDVLVPGGVGNAGWPTGYAALEGWQPGDSRYFQVWYRDTTPGPCASGYNLSSGQAVTFTP